MTHKEDAILAGAAVASRQPSSVELPSVPHEVPARDVPPTIQYMDDETFRRSLEKVASIHERLLAKLAE